MSDETPDFTEDHRILDRLQDPLDVEAFSNLMEHAHQKGMSAADFVREEPDRTSRKAIRKLCLKDRQRSLWVQITSTLRSMWDRPSEDPAAAYMQSLYGPVKRPSDVGKNGQSKG